MPTRYRSSDEDSARWDGFVFRDDDIVISTRSKSGTTWMQMICALLILQTTELPAPLNDLSPWLDWLVTPCEEVYALLAAQRHRRFIKTHTPLDGVPIDARVTYIVVVRDPLDTAVSLYHQSANINRERLAQLTGLPQHEVIRPPLHEWLLSWIDRDVRPADQLDSLPGILWHASDAWARREVGNVVLVRYEDLSLDLDGQMRALASRLGIGVPESVWPALVEAATFTKMRERAVSTVPDRQGVLKDSAAFFRRGSTGNAREVLTAEEIAHYEHRAGQLAAPDVVTWLSSPGRPPAR